MICTSIDGLKVLLKDSFEALYGALSSIDDIIVDAAQLATDLVTSIGNALGQALGAMGDLITDAVNGIGSIVADFASAAMQKAAELVGAIKNSIIGQYAIATINKIKEGFGNLVDAAQIIAKALGDVIGLVTTKIGDLVVTIGQLGSSIGNAIMGLIADISDVVSNAIGTALETVSGVIGDIVNFATNAINEAVCAGLSLLFSSIGPDAKSS